MTSTPSPHAQAIGALYADLTAATQLADPDLTTEANRRRQAEAVAAAKVKFDSLAPKAPAEQADPRAAVLAARRPSTADQIAMNQREMQRVNASIEDGRTIEDVIRTASPETVAAIADEIELLPSVREAGDSVAEAEALRDLAFGRLVELGDQDAGAAAAGWAEQETAAAWHEVGREARDGLVSVGALSRLYRIDQAGYEQLAAFERPDYDSVSLIEAAHQMDAN